jgi:hypothetical protein
LLWDRNALENVAQERSWFCPAIERALGLLPSIALSSHSTDLIVGSGRLKSIGLRLKTDCRRSTLNSLIFGLDIGEYLIEWLQDRETKKKFEFLHLLYWMASGYGERITRAVMVLGLLWLVFAFSYTKVGFEHKANKPGNDQQSIAAQEDVGKPLPFKKVFTYSLGVMSLQKPDPKPVTIAAQTLVFLETILCPIQAALLALAIRRRFMR